ncbi:MAG: NUDIX domain-containing protein [Candidatus Aenigmarchaeota archaeon]|nr:NUDIX domain-containing protein [Candidatus Aenigmarchaeota archaeon]
MRIAKGKIPERTFSEIRKFFPLLTVDGIVFLDNKILLVKRSERPYRGYWVLPGGYVEVGETVEEAVLREVREETGLDTEIGRMVGVYSDPGRDPRGHNVAIAYVLKVIGGEIRPEEKETSDVRYFKTMPKRVGFDHSKMITDAKRLIRSLKV